MAEAPLSFYFRDPARHAAGVDFSGSQLRYVQLVPKKNKRIAVLGFGSAPLEPGIIQNGEIVDDERLKRVLRGALSGKHRAVTSVFGGLPERHTFLKYIDLQATSKTDLAEAVRWEATQHIPYDLKEIVLDWVPLTTGDAKVTEVLTVAVPITISERFSNAIQGAGFAPLSLEPSTLAVCRAFREELPPSAAGILLLLGEVESSAVLMEDRVPLFSAALPFMTAQLETAITQQFNLKSEDTKKALRLLGFSKTRARGTIRGALDAYLRSIADRLNEVEAFYQDHFSHAPPVKNVILCGPGALIVGIADELSSRIHKTVTVARLPKGTVISRHAQPFADAYLEYSVAFGLALRSSASNGYA